MTNKPYTSKELYTEPAYEGGKPLHRVFATRNQIVNTEIRTHIHDGNLSQRIQVHDLAGSISTSAMTTSATIATTGNTDAYFIVPFVQGNRNNTVTLQSVVFSAVDALAASDTNYITWTITNLGQDGLGSTTMLAATDSNTTKATGGTAIAANTKRTLTLNATPANLNATIGDRLRIRAAATGTLANTVTFPIYSLTFS